MNTTALTVELADQLEGLATIASTAGMTSIAAEIRDERLPAVREGRMSVVVLGEFNHGKSTAINALLGSEVLPTGITPTTSVITHIRAGDGRVRVVRDGGVDEMGLDDLRALVTSDAAEDLRYVELSVASPFLTDGLVVVDTPGVNDISKQKVEITYGYVPRADVVIYVLDATQALKRSELTFIETRLIRNAHNRIFFLLGKTDALSAAEVEEIVAHVKGKLELLLGEVPLFPVSARRAMRGEDPSFDVFREAVTSYLAEQHAEIVLDGGVRTGLRLASLIDQSLAIEQTALSLESDELEKRLASVHTRLTKSRSMVAENLSLIDERTTEIVAAARDNVKSFARDFSAALPGQVQRVSTEDVRRYLPDFIHDTYKEWLEAEGTHVAMRLEMLAEEIISITNRNTREMLTDVYGELGVRTRDLDLEVDTFGYDVSVFALGALGATFLAFSNMLVGGLLTLATPVLAFALKGKVDATIRERATEQGLHAIENATKKVDEEFERAVREFSTKLKQFVEDSGERLYRQVSEALERVVHERSRYTHDRAGFAEELDGVRADVARTHSALLEMRTRLTEERGA